MSRSEAQPGRGVAGLLILLAALALAWGCGGRRFPPPEDIPPENHLRRLVVLVERPGFRPAAGVKITIETEESARLLSPADGSGRTDGQGRLELVFAPRPHPVEAARAAGDLIVEYPVLARLTLGGGQTRIIEDRETFARYADPNYQGLNRDPDPGPAYYLITLP